MTLLTLIGSTPLVVSLVMGSELPSAASGGQEGNAGPGSDQAATKAAPAARPGEAPADWKDREAELLARIRDLKRELREQQQIHLAREQEWLEYTRVLKSFRLPSLPEPPAFIAEALKPAPDPLAEAEARSAAARARRGEEILVQLGALLIAESVRGLDVLEAGVVHEHDGRAVTGPVIARILDDRGRMVGMLKAEHLRLETSRSSRSVTIVLEDGYESRGGRVSPFDGGGFTTSEPFDADGNLLEREVRAGGGVRRIFLGSVDPEPWIEAFPDLVDARSLEPVVDDGLWDVGAVRARLSRVLRESSRAGDASWQVVALGGVRNGELRDVQLVERSAFGGAPRRVFADVGTVRPGSGDRGVEIALEGGTVRRGDRVAPFLGGRYRIVLPSADLDAWREARIPGLSVPRAKPPQ